MTEQLHFHFSLSCVGEGHGNPLQCSCLENPRDSGAWWAAVYGVAQSRARLKRLSSSSSSSSLIHSSYTHIHSHICAHGLEVTIHTHHSHILTQKTYAALWKPPPTYTQIRILHTHFKHTLTPIQHIHKPPPTLLSDLTYTLPISHTHAGAYTPHRHILTYAHTDTFTDTSQHLTCTHTSIPKHPIIQPYITDKLTLTKTCMRINGCRRLQESFTLMKANEKWQTCISLFPFLYLFGCTVS